MSKFNGEICYKGGKYSVWEGYTGVWNFQAEYPSGFTCKNGTGLDRADCVKQAKSEIDNKKNHKSRVF